MKIFNSTTLKIVAIITMTIDHIGVNYQQAFLGLNIYDQEVYILMRTIGRIAFPIFAFQIAEGFKHTSNVKRYLMNLFVFALVTDLLFDLFQVDFPGRNIFFTLFLGLLSLYSLKNFKLGYLAIIPVLFVSEYLNVDYGMYGVLAVIIFYYFNENMRIIMFILLNVLFILFLGFGSLQFYSIAALPFINLYNGERGFKLNKYVFYTYYPAHLIILPIIFEKIALQLN
jgi:hypothetical protein